MNKNLRFFIIFFGIVVVAFFATLSNQSFYKKINTNNPTNQNTPTAKTVSIVFQQNGQDYEYTATIDDKSTIYQLTEMAAQDKKLDFGFKDYGELGIMITRIGTQTNGEDQKYWQYYINGQLAQIGASAYVPNAGDKIVWKFEKSTF